MLYMIIERFRNGDAVPVYQRFRDSGRLAPEGLTYISSYVTTDLAVCYQIMESDRRELLDQWVARWADLVDFDIIPVVTSKEAYEAISPRLREVRA
jgi:hypothetical protein